MTLTHTQLQTTWPHHQGHHLLLQAAAAAYNVDPKIWMLTGGDDHALVACLPEDVELPDGFLEIGQVREGAAQVTVDGSEPEWLEGPGGFTHFA